MNTIGKLMSTAILTGALTAMSPVNEPSVFDVYEEFVDRASFDAHQARVKESSWGACTKGLVREYTITDASTPSA